MPAPNQELAGEKAIEQVKSITLQVELVRTSLQTQM